MILFNIIYDRGFAIPRSVDKLKTALRTAVKAAPPSTFGNHGNRAILIRRIRSIPKLAIRVGSFHHLHRLLTPTFIDFCVKNTGRLTIAYRKYVGSGN